jgi:hypothetical protein
MEYPKFGLFLNDKYKIARELVFLGIGMHESVVHFGACDTDLNFIDAVDQFELDIQYTAVDVKDEIKTLFTDLQPAEKTHTWISTQESMQEFIDNIEDQKYTWSIITGVFDKPIYSERQYQFIDTIVKSCKEFSENVVFTLNVNTSTYFQYSIVYLFSHFMNLYDSVTIKKIDNDNYIFHIY